MSIADTILEFLARPGIGNILIFIAAVVGVFGSYILYRTKQAHQRESLRVALLYELYCIEQRLRKLEHDTDEAIRDDPAPEVFYNSSIYDNNADSIGLLSPEEVGAVTDFYTSANLVHESAKRNPGGVFIGIANEELYKKLIIAFQELDSNVDDSISPDSSDFEDPIELSESVEPL